jgi:hypothetical protein
MNSLTMVYRRAARLATVVIAFATLAAGVAPASAATAVGPRLQVHVIGQPTDFAPGDSSGTDTYYIDVTNVGDQPTCDASVDPSCNITISDALPGGLTVTSVEFYDAVTGGRAANWSGFLCTAGSAQCTYPGILAGFFPYSQLALQPGETLKMWVHVGVAASLAQGTLTDTVSVGGGGAPNASDATSNLVSSTPAGFGLNDYEMHAVNRDGTPYTQAGGHPWALTTRIDLNTDLGRAGIASGGEIPVVPQYEQHLDVTLPRGMIGDPQAIPQCPLSTFESIGGQTYPNHSPCPADTQIGTVQFQNDEGGATNADTTELVPLFNLVPQPRKAAELGFMESSGDPFILTAGVRTGSDYALTTDTLVPPGNVSWVDATIWGTPSDSSHDGQRGMACDTLSGGAECAGGGEASGAPANAFLSMPTYCSGQSLTSPMAVDTWTNPGVFTDATASMPAVTGCDALGPFAPTLSVAPDTSQAGAPAGLAVDIKVPQVQDPNQNVAPHLRDVTVALPQGLVIDPSSANGLGSCSDAQLALNSPDPASCPDASKIGTVELHTPLLANPLPGSVYVGEPQCSPCSPADAAAGRMVRLFIEINDPLSGVVVKLSGTVSIDQSTGQLTSTFLQNPELPFDELQVTLKGGARAPLVNPSTCGSFTTTSDFTPWSSPFTLDATPSSTFDVAGCGDPSTFAPTFTAGVQNAQAGAYAPFVLSFQRTDADQQFSGLTVSLPPGLVAKLAGVPLCSDSDANAGTCPAASQVGDVETGAGAGSEPYFLPGKAYLTGPYKGGPYGLAVVVPAVAGPYNLGTVVVRQALYVDPTTAQVTAVSDPFPTQLDGILLRIRRVDVSMDRPGFVVNPTSCDPMAITGDLTSTGGMTAPVSSRLQVGGCQGLGFSPKLAFRLTGGGQTHSGNHPTLTATLTQGAGQANIRNAKVALPLSLALDINNSQHVCSYDTAQAVHGGAVGCPASTIVGNATAITPLLDRPLSGPVYLVQGIRFGKNGQRIHTLPSLLVPLRGQIAIDLRASSAVNGAQQLVTTFNTIPDAPVSKFTLTINGGRKGILVITGRGQTICGKSQVANADFGAQSGKTEAPNPQLATPACRGFHTARHARRHGRRHARRHGARRVR